MTAAATAFTDTDNPAHTDTAAEVARNTPAAAHRPAVVAGNMWRRVVTGRGIVRGG